MKKFLLVGFVALSSLALHAQIYKPALNLAVGQKYTVVVTSKSLNIQEAGGQKMEIPNESSQYQTLEVKAATDKGYQLSAVTTRFVTATSMMGQEMNYDSDKKADRDGKMGDMLNKKVGNTTTFEVDKEGKIIEGSIVKAKEEGEADPMEAIQNAVMISMGMPEIVSKAFNLFNDSKEMKIGDSFTATSLVGDGKEGKSTTVYTLASIKDGIANFTYTGTGNLEKPFEMQGMEIAATFGNKTSGEMQVDIATGLLVKKTFAGETTGKVEVQGQEMPSSSTSTITITVAAVK
jgi:Family of unknown function (DUF6263)